MVEREFSAPGKASWQAFLFVLLGAVPA